LTPDVLSYADAFSYIGLLGGTVIYAKYLKHVTFRKIFFWAQLSKVAFSMLDLVQLTRFNIKLGIPDLAFVMGFGTIYEVFSRFKTMPFLVLSAQLCPKHCEATFFALLMSISNSSGSVSGLIGSQFLTWFKVTQTNFEGLVPLVVLRSLGLAIPLCFLSLVPDTTSILPPSDMSDESIELQETFDSNDEVLHDTYVDQSSTSVRSSPDRATHKRSKTQGTDEEGELFLQRF
jgi:hypothetical protein